MLDGISTKSAIVTGSGSFIGRAIAIRLAKEGAKVIIAEIKDDTGKETEKMITDMGGKAIFMHTDVTIEKDVANAVKAAIDNFGKLDFMINNAGGFTTGLIWELDEVKDWDFTMNLCAKGVFFGIKHAAKAMIPRREGKIINIDSNLGKTAVATKGPYCAAKFAIVGLTQCAALELIPYDINVNNICPGNQNNILHINTTKALIKMKGLDKSWEDVIEEQKSNRIHHRLGEPTDIASAVAFLCSSEADFITGQSINVCGGLEFH